MEYILIGVKNEGSGPSGSSQAQQKLRSHVHSVAEVHPFEMPELRVGTLEKLMASGDAMHKVDMHVESVVRKIERQYEELNTDSDGVLSVEGGPPLRYLENFRWNAAKYSTQRAVDELVRQIVQAAHQTEAELKETAAFTAEKKQKMQFLQRAKDGSLMVCNLDDSLTPNVNPEWIHDSEYLKSAVIIVPKSLEKDFLEGYERIGSDIVPYNPEQDVKGSPVVPNSAKRVMEDKDGYVAYIVTILKKFYDDFKTAAQSARFLVRDYDFEKSYAEYNRLRLEEGSDQVTKAENEYKEASMQLLDWCRAHYSDAFIAWIHIKAIRTFVEAVLRYGLPVNYFAALVEPKKGAEKKVREKLFHLYQSYDESGMMQAVGDESGGASEEMFPYVSYKIAPFGAEKATNN